MSAPDAPAPPETSAPEPQVGEGYVRLLAWAVSNCHTLARRRLNAQSTDAEWWSHVLRICEKAGAKSAGVLRAAVPTEITEGQRPETSAPPALAWNERIEQLRRVYNHPRLRNKLFWPVEYAQNDVGLQPVDIFKHGPPPPKKRHKRKAKR